MASATISTSPYQANLAFYKDPSAIFSDLQRRDNGMPWATIQTGISNPQAPTDATIQTGHSYEWRLVNYNNGHFVISYSRSAFAATAPGPTLMFGRGKIILVVDQGLRSFSGNAQANVDWSVQRLTRNLVGDGWTVVGPHYVARHNDSGSNYANLTNNLAIVRADYANSPTDTKGVLIVGHVTIPYSGLTPADGHAWQPDGSEPSPHDGAWPADLMYGTMDIDVWDVSTQNTALNTNSVFPANWNQPGDGKYDQDSTTGNTQLFVGRIDFANLPSFGTSTSATDPEASLLRTYVTKNDNYRNKIAPFPVDDRAVVHGTFVKVGFPPFTYLNDLNAVVYRNIKYLLDGAFAAGSYSYAVADPFFRTSGIYPEASSCLWGFLAGPGVPNGISIGLPGSPPWLQHLTSDIANVQNEPHVAFYCLYGSYFMDWNMQDDFLRGTLATPNYGLAGIIAENVLGGTGRNISLWNFGTFETGQPLGNALQATASNTGIGIDRMFALMGDPTLRIHTLRPVNNLTNSGGLSWSPPAEPGTFTYYVFRATSLTNAFTNLTPSGTTLTSYPEYIQGMQYMVRASQLRTAGRGSSYVNASQGAFYPTVP